MYYVKFPHSLLDLPAYGMLEPADRCRAFELWIVANENGGALPEPDRIAWRLRIPADAVAGILERLQAAGAVVVDDAGNATPAGFADAQRPTAAAARMRRSRARAVQEKEEKDEEENNIVYRSRNVTRTVTQHVTQHVTPQTDAEAIAAVASLIDRWSSHVRRRPAPAEYTERFFRPANDLLLECAWNGDAAFDILQAERAAMIAAGLRPYRIDAVVASRAAGGAAGAGAGNNGRPPRAASELEFLFGVIGQGETLQNGNAN